MALLVMGVEGADARPSEEDERGSWADHALHARSSQTARALVSSFFTSAWSPEIKVFSRWIHQFPMHCVSTCMTSRGKGLFVGRQL